MSEPNSRKFLEAYCLIETYLKRRADVDRRTTFFQLIDALAGSNAVVRRFAPDLKEYGDLRNAIVHERGDGRVIAEPHDTTVEHIQRIAELLTNPPVITPLFQKTVFTLSDSSPVSTAVKVMFDNNISQIPILHQKTVIGLLTTNTITRWLGKHVADDIFSLQETSVAEVLLCAEENPNKKANYIFLKQSASVFDAIEYFATYAESGSQLDAILITAHGRHNEGLIGIMTITDFPEAHQAVSK